MNREENIPLAPLTTFRIGGPARFLLRAASVADVREALAFARGKELPVLLLGGGSNMLVDDAGFPGVVVKIEIPGITVERPQNGALLVAGAGEEWDALVARAAQEGLWGIENLSGIPGTAGAAPVQNIGAYGAELKDALAWVEALDRESGAVVRLARDACGFGYRTSIFKRQPGRWCILRIALALAKKGMPNVSYRDLAEAFKDAPPPVLGDVRRTVLAIRARKFPDLTREGTAGSFFLNPTLPSEEAARLRERFPELPQFSVEGGVKVPLAWLLDRALALRGARSGGARLFERQPLVVVAERSTSARDVRALALDVRNKVRDALGITVQFEVQIIS